ncbi:hypothetical protein MCO_00569 [Bartonella sp. DB5-6]|nr:hypothetical protein MCO_00569 [Bartonella sp. DB5-6]
MIIFGLFATYYSANEYIRLSPYIGQNNMTWNDVFPYFDRMVLGGVIVGIVILGLTILSSVLSDSRNTDARVLAPHGE